MQADDHPIEVILAEGRRFMVPLYQRKYQWHDFQLLPFWQDVEAKAIEVLAVSYTHLDVYKRQSQYP